MRISEGRGRFDQIVPSYIFYMEGTGFQGVNGGRAGPIGGIFLRDICARAEYGGLFFSSISFFCGLDDQTKKIFCE